VEDWLFAQLYVAECLGALGRREEMRAAIRDVRHQRQPFGAPAFEELFTCLDRGDLDQNLIAHVREYLDGASQPGAAEYRPLRLSVS
jgi:hypothetical protein